MGVIREQPSVLWLW